MKKRKIISIVVSLALAFGSMASLVVTADDAEPVQPVTTDEPATTEEPIKEPTILPNDWHFVDIAHNGDTIVALAKNDTIGSLQFNTQGRLYYSADGGETWKPSEKISHWHQMRRFPVTEPHSSRFFIGKKTICLLLTVVQVHILRKTELTGQKILHCTGQQIQCLRHREIA